MAGTGHNAQLRSLVERIESLQHEKESLTNDISEIYAEAKSNGYDVKALRAVIKRRKHGPDAPHEMQVEAYLLALGDLKDTPLGQAALHRDIPSTADAPFHTP